MILTDISPFFARDARLLADYAGRDTLWRAQAQDALAQYARDLPTDDAIGAIQQARRVMRVFTAGLENDAGFLKTLAGATMPLWTAFNEPPVPRALQDTLAEKLYIVQAESEAPLLEIGDQARYIGVRLFDRCVSEKRRFDISVHDENFFALLINAADVTGIAALAADLIAARAEITTRILCQHNLPEWTVIEPDPVKIKAYRAALAPWRERVLSGKMRSVLTSIPTQRDAVVDGIAHADYATLYFRMCDQPWDLIRTAQARLIETLNAGKNLHFTNEDGTDLRMSIDGFTFCNSVIARNIPGSEVFSAPEIDSVNGVIVAQGRFTARDDAGAIMENLRLTFRDGLLVEALAESGQAHLDRVLDTDAGARRVGEIGIGTNPYLKQHVASILLSEKIGGSFHIALGDAYTMTDYLGERVHVDNGNRSLVHWDITTMLYGKGGRIVLDGAPIMIDGAFTDPALDVLNRGWRAVPFDQRPPAWQDIYTEK
ncbi:MAG: aminopeptidase [Rhodospirillales bacterium]|nr:aminopeptidase [Alphaproteobacteria bacterium]MCB9986598.1 aminopeptidase [Rhodospirillales bacterium]USO06872.1 MAG: aminopeptidase [Rhodospirillales bacterium]